VSGYHIVIPARYASSRLPGKPLIDIAGKPMILHVVERARECGADSITVATDDLRIFDILAGHGVGVLMTSDRHESGTDRLAEVAEVMGWSKNDIVVNLQGDEPLMPASVVRQVARNLDEHALASMATLCTPLESYDEMHNPHAVKVVMDAAGYALYFSRAPIPWYRDGFGGDEQWMPTMTACYRHLGLYAYRAGFLKRYTGWQTAPIEQCESLEQLRALWQGEKIHVAVAEEIPPPGVDTEADLERVRQVLEA
jgi:3-deoxy-manno-octulosonate cytidylyltransferase (CMP-KDO synthetase)